MSATGYGGWMSPTKKAGTGTSASQPFGSITGGGTSGAAGMMNLDPHNTAQNRPGYTPPSAQPKAAPYGYASGPGILQQWFNERASGTDPGYEYAMKRGIADINSQNAARGSYNSGANTQDISDFGAKMAAAREAQLDNLAGAASGERQNSLNSMFGEGNALASGQAGLTGAYDLGAAGAMSNALTAATGMGLAKAGVDSKATQNLVNNGFAGLSLANMFGGGNGSGAQGGAVQPNGLMAPSF